MTDSLENLTVTAVRDVMCVRSEKNRRFEMTNRPFYALSLCKSGRITYSMEGEITVSEPGNAVLLPMGASYRLFGNETGEFPLVNFSAEGLEIRRILTFPLREPAMCLRTFRTMEQAFLFEKNRLKTLRCFYELAEQIRTPPMENGILAAAERFLTEHLFDPGLTNETLANAAGVGEVCLRKAFLTQYGIPPHRYILNARIAKAKQLLSSTALTVGEIGRKCGFPDPYHFSRLFRQYVGIPPTDFRRGTRGI